MSSTPRMALALFAVSVALFATAQRAHGAGIFAGQDVDPRFKAKIMKEKAKQNGLTANRFNAPGTSSADAQCGSQNIGNIDTGGRIGASPREVFVFAPNAINLVSGQGCR